MLEKDGETKVLCFLITGKDSSLILILSLCYGIPDDTGNNPFGIGILLVEAIPSVTKRWGTIL
jgi:hypothetical protein